MTQSEKIIFSKFIEKLLKTKRKLEAEDTEVKSIPLMMLDQVKNSIFEKCKKDSAEF